MAHGTWITVLTILIAGAGAAQAEEYNFEHFDERFSVTDAPEFMSFPEGSPEPGALAPDFSLPTTGGDTFKLSGFRGKKPVLLVTSSMTCPVTAGATSVLKKWHDRYGDDVEFVSIYVRELHPGERYPAHKSDAQKMKHAKDWAWQDRIPWTVAVDTLEGAVDHRYGPTANAAYLIDSTGHVAWRQLYAGQGLLLKGEIQNLLRAEADNPGEPVLLGERENLIVPAIHTVPEVDHSVRRGGEVALRDLRNVIGTVPYGVAIFTGNFLQPIINPGNNEIE